MAITKQQKQDWLLERGIQKSAVSYLRKSDGWDWKAALEGSVSPEDLAQALVTAYDVKKATFAKLGRTAPDTDTPFRATAAQRKAPAKTRKPRKPKAQKVPDPDELEFLSVEQTSVFMEKTGATFASDEGWVLFDKSGGRVYGRYETREEALQRAVLWEG